MKRNRWLCLAMAGLMTASMFLAGCGGNGNSTTAAGGETKAGGTQGATEANAGAGTETGAATTGKDSLIIGHWGDPPSLDPNNSMNDCSMRVTTNVFDTLVRMDEHFKAQPCIAESWTCLLYTSNWIWNRSSLQRRIRNTACTIMDAMEAGPPMFWEMR